MKLGYIIGQKDKAPYKCVEPLKTVEFMDDNRAYIEEIDGRWFIVDAARIVLTDFTKSAANIGNCYKIPVEYIAPYQAKEGVKHDCLCIEH